MIGIEAEQNKKDAEFLLRNVKRAHRDVGLKKYSSWILTAVIFSYFFWLFATNKNFEWHVVYRWFLEPTILQGLRMTLWLTAVAMLLGTFLGLFFALLRMSNNRLFQLLAGLYIWFFRGTPLLVQLIFWYNLAALFPMIFLGVPFTSIGIAYETNELITPLTAAIVGLSLNEAAYMAEVIRGGLLSVDKGQQETAKSFGMSATRALWRIILPQAMRAIIPPTGNQLVSLLKATSLVSVIAMNDLLYSVQTIYNNTFEIIPMLMVAVIWYLVVTSLLNIGQLMIERYYSRGASQSQ